ncbi:M20/M25/M40 family metallo-hydrolase [Clostridium sp. KNHs216]|uniref:M20/M25/M40 family metallo-hydrolase n=1 Tax=Clostridium sp. KNHs216 TaxID=1550235 RepID=UPI001170D96D|nr:M20/M25/M40 family metallo-hydrolase [Clostridium sp. KNHs216]TQI68288.1 arginine utilization protein RocB [Clostridium sp. KNHs216]
MLNETIYRNFLELCGVPSVSETDGEWKMAEKIAAMLKEIPYFHSRPHQVRLCPVPGDPCRRSFVCALLEGGIKSEKTVVLLSHFDVVGVEEFGVLKGLAFDPVAYTHYLRTHPEVRLPEEAKRDLESGDYLFGRGTMDMKFGIAADLEMLRRAGEHLPDFEGNLLFLSVPDEEANSAGMLAAVELLLSMKKEKRLDYRCCLVSEPHFPKYPGDGGKYLYTGTVGKLLPAFYCVGRETHACEPFAGLNPNLLTSKIIERVDSNPELCDFAGGTHVPPPVCLKQADVKTAYSVQTPTAAYAYFNYMTLTQTPAQVMERMIHAAEDAFSAALEDIRNNAGKYARITGNPALLPSVEPKVVSFQELYDCCLKAHGQEFDRHMKEYIRKLQAENPGEDLRELSVAAVREAHTFYPYRGPMVIVFYAPPFYPHSDLPSPDSRAVETAGYLVETARTQYGETLLTEPFFPGLSDMSYLGLSARIDIFGLTKDFPVWGSGYQIPLETIAQLNIPFLNIGPHGRDAHQFTERLCLSYSFEKAVPLLWAAVRHLLA